MGIGERRRLFESFHEDPPGDLYLERRSPWGLIGDSDFDGDIRGNLGGKFEELFEQCVSFFNEGDGYFVEVRIVFS